MIINTVIAGGGTTPTGTLPITNNGIYDVTNYASADVQVPTTAPALYREFQLDNTGKLVSNTTTTHIMDFTGMTDVDNYMLPYMYANNTAISGAVDMSDLTTISGGYACYAMFAGCTGLTSAILSSLTAINGGYACGAMFLGCTGLVSANLSALTTIPATYACDSMFANCTGLTSIALTSLSTIGTLASYALSRTFQNCTGLVSADLSALTTIQGNRACEYLFNGCTSLTTVYIGGTTAIDFGTRTNQFNNMFYGCTQNMDVYAPAANQATIEAFSGYPNFGATGTVTWHWRS